MRQQQVLAAGGGSCVVRAGTSSASSFVGHDAGAGVGADDLRRLAARRARADGQRPAQRRRGGRRGQGPARGRRGHQRRGPAAGASRPVTWSRSRPQTLGGGGGGKDDVAQGGGTDATKVGEALARIEHMVGERVTGRSLTAMRTGVRLGVDVGSVRVGLAASDPSGMIATPVQTLPPGPRRRVGPARRSPRSCGARGARGGRRACPGRCPGRRAAAAALARDYAGRARRTGRSPARCAWWTSGCPRWMRHRSLRDSRRGRPQAARRGGPGGRRAHPPGRRWTASVAPVRRPGSRWRPVETADLAGPANPGNGQRVRTDEGPAPRELDLR